MNKRFDLSVYLITDPVVNGGRPLPAVVEAALAGGVSLVQLRDPHAKTRALVDQARALLALLRPRRIPLIINDRVDVALAADADGVHVGQNDMDARDVRRLIGPDKIVGLSVGNLAEYAASEAALAAVDYVGVGPVFATPVKTDAGPAIGFEGLRVMRQKTTLPLVAIGGVRPDAAAACIAAGADGVAVVSAIMAAADPGAAAGALAQAVRTARV